MSVLDYVDVGVYLYQKLNDETETAWIIKDINRKDLLIENKSSGKKYKMTEKELEALYRKQKIRISRKGE